VETNGHGPFYSTILSLVSWDWGKHETSVSVGHLQVEICTQDLLNTRKVCTLLEHDFRGANAVVLMDIKRLSGKRLRTSTLKESPGAFPCSTKFRCFCIKVLKASAKLKFRTLLTLTDRKPMWNTNSPNWRETWSLKLGPLFFLQVEYRNNWILYRTSYG